MPLFPFKLTVEYHGSGGEKYFQVEGSPHNNRLHTVQRNQRELEYGSRR